MKKLIPSVFLVLCMAVTAFTVVSQSESTALARGTVPPFLISNVNLLAYSTSSRRIELKTVLIDHSYSTDLSASYTADGGAETTLGNTFTNKTHNAESFSPPYLFAKNVPLMESSFTFTGKSTADSDQTESLSVPATGSHTTLLSYDIYKASMGNAVLIIPKVTVKDGRVNNPKKTTNYVVQYYAEGAMRGVQEWRAPIMNVSVRNGDAKIIRDMQRIECGQLPLGYTKLKLVDATNGNVDLQSTADISVATLCGGSSSSAPSEMGMCTDGIDNDNDEDIDCEDTQCEYTYECSGSSSSAPVTETICDDEIDNDMDEYMDCDDSNCSSDPVCMQHSSSSYSWPSSSSASSASSFSYPWSSSSSSWSSSSWGY